MASVVVAEFDAALRATIIKSHNLHYAAGADPSEDRPAHVRAGSSLTVFRGQLAVIQDDAHFIALLNPDTLEVSACALPRGEQGLRQFDDLRGNKRYKLDLEAATVVPAAGGEALLALGSGSRRSRESAILVTGQGAAPELVVQAGDRARWGKLFDPTGRELRAKVEGVCSHPRERDRLFILLDRDDPQRAAELCELRLTGE